MPAKSSCLLLFPALVALAGCPLEQDPKRPAPDDAGAGTAPRDAGPSPRREIPWDWELDGGPPSPPDFGEADASAALTSDARRDTATSDPATKCRPYDFGSCLCSSVESNTLATCTAKSIEGPLQKGLCCKGSYTCWCYAIECRLSRLGNCSCGSAVTSSDTLVASCTPYTRTDHCCLQAGTSTRRPRCSCGPLSCGADREVASCSPADVASCPTADTETTVCKG